jgi:hypothetical protein
MLALPAQGDVYRSHDETPAKTQWLPLLPLPMNPSSHVSIPTSGPPADMEPLTSEPGVQLPDLLSNSLILNHIAPYLLIDALLHLSATSRYVRDLILHTPGVFRHLDLSAVSSAQFHMNGVGRVGSGARGNSNVFRSFNQAELRDNLTEDDFYSAPLNTIFATLAHRSLLPHVQTLVLDGLSVTSERCHEILTSDAFSVRILSIRNVRNLNQAKLRQTLQYICRPSRPEGTPRLKGLYIFGGRDGRSTRSVDYDNRSRVPFQSRSTGYNGRPAIIASVNNDRSHPTLDSPVHAEADQWWNRRGKVLFQAINEEWAHTMLSCYGIVAFDAVMCQSPNHHSSPAYRRDAHGSNFRPPPWAVATMAVSGCAQCGRAPEGMTRWSYENAYKLPLLAPVPIFGSTIPSATRPRHADLAFVPRCSDCLHRRYCWACNKWWCEDCYHGPTDDPHHKPPVSRDCWECGMNCDDCLKRTMSTCTNCKLDYCTLHNNRPATGNRCHRMIPRPLADPLILESLTYPGPG